jgi:hypothetical protein
MSVYSFHQEKVKYYDIATKNRAEFEKAMAEYNKKKVRCTCFSSELLPS